MEGALLYVNDDETRLEMIHPSWSEIVSLVRTRNALAAYLAPEQNLQPTKAVSNAHFFEVATFLKLWAMLFVGIFKSSAAYA